MTLNYGREQYAVAADIMRAWAEENPDDKPPYLVAASACEEILKLAEQVRILRHIIANAATDLSGKLEHFDRFSS